MRDTIRSAAVRRGQPGNAAGVKALACPRIGLDGCVVTHIAAPGALAALVSRIESTVGGDATTEDRRPYSTPRTETESASDRAGKPLERRRKAPRTETESASDGDGKCLGRRRKVPRTETESASDGDGKCLGRRRKASGTETESASDGDGKCLGRRRKASGTEAENVWNGDGECLERRRRMSGTGTEIVLGWGHEDRKHPKHVPL